MSPIWTSNQIIMRWILEMLNGLCQHLSLVRAILEYLGECYYGGERGKVAHVCCKIIIKKMSLLHLMFSFFCLILMPLSTQSSLCHYTPHYPLRWHSKREPQSHHIERGFRAETKRTLQWVNCQQICLLSWVMDLAPELLQQDSAFKQLFNSSCTTAPSQLWLTMSQ